MRIGHSTEVYEMKKGILQKACRANNPLIGQNTARALAKPFVGVVKGTGRGFMEFGGSSNNHDSDSVYVNIIAAGIGAVWGLGHGTLSLGSSAVKGAGNFLRVRTPKESHS